MNIDGVQGVQGVHGFHVRTCVNNLFIPTITYKNNFLARGCFSTLHTLHTLHTSSNGASLRCAGFIFNPAQPCTH
jgi:hypothetical protein